MELYRTVGEKKLRCGYTTGSCAAGAAKAAAEALFSGRFPEEVVIPASRGIFLPLKPTSCSRTDTSCRCAVRKDSGDDPDVTNGILVFAEVSELPAGEFRIDGGEGVGRVTRPGMACAVGEAAINPGPRAMILDALREVSDSWGGRGLSAVISVPGGAQLAEKTFNPRLGIEGGISILGTTGIVEPMSEDALTESIYLELRMRKAAGQDVAVLVPGNYGQSYLLAQGLKPEQMVLCSNFIGDAVSYAAGQGFSGLLLAGHIGKLVKLAAGMFNTHSKYGDARMDILLACAAQEGISVPDACRLADAVTTEAALDILETSGILEPVLNRLLNRAEQQLRRKSGEMPVSILIFSEKRGLLISSGNAGAMLSRVKEGAL